MKKIFLIWLTLLVGVSLWILYPESALAQSCNITSPTDSQALRAGEVFQITGTFQVNPELEYCAMDISIDRGPWTATTVTSYNAVTGAGTWSHNWTPTPGDHTLKARVTYFSYTYSDLVNITAYSDAISSIIDSPMDGQEITGGIIFPITGTVTIDPFATGLAKVEVSTNGGQPGIRPTLPSAPRGSRAGHTTGTYL